MRETTAESWCKKPEQETTAESWCKKPEQVTTAESWCKKPQQEPQQKTAAESRGGKRSQEKMAAQDAARALLPETRLAAAPDLSAVGRAY
ncbi:hypothetical protein HA44_17160 [Mixta gaviniae]|nr:hypothetical protein HA44_17160 [Mixta gaviniae]